MATKGNKTPFPGSIYKPANANRLYIKFKGKRIATGLKPDKEGYKVAQQLLQHLYFEYFGMDDIRKSISIQEAINEYLDQLKKIRSYNTIRSYTNTFASILNGKNFILNKINVLDTLRKFDSNKKLLPSTYNARLVHFSSFLKYCSNKNYIEKFEIVSQFKRNKMQKKPIKSFTIKECYFIMKEFSNRKDIYKEIGYLIYIMIETGARMVDALSLEWKDVDIENKYVTWKNKITKYPEKRPISTRAANMFKFLKTKNKKQPFNLSYNQSSNYRRRLRVVMNKLGIDTTDKSYHKFRVTFRMRLKAKGMPEEDIKYLMRHSDASLIYESYTDWEIIENRMREFLDKK